MKSWDEAYESLDVEGKKSVRRWKKGVKGQNGLTKDRNQCPSCGEFFSSTSAFDKHRTGPFGKPDGTPSNRRCLTIPEMTAKGFQKNFYFYWTRGGNPLYAEDSD